MESTLTATCFSYFHSLNLENIELISYCVTLALPLHASLRVMILAQAREEISRH